MTLKSYMPIVRYCTATKWYVVRGQGWIHLDTAMTHSYKLLKDLTMSLFAAGWPQL